MVRPAFAILLLCIVGSSMAVRLRVSDTQAPVATNPTDLRQKQANYQAELAKFIAETNKVKLIKWGDYDVYVNQNCPQPPTKPEGSMPQLDPIKNCLEASTDAQIVAKEIARITAEAAT